jgi:sugar/nucleoside kinase (ribokinase family)
VGNLTIDYVFFPHTKKYTPALGGSAAYASIAARNLGAKVAIISKVGSDFPTNFKQCLIEKGVDLSGLKMVSNSKTTRFILSYENDKRKFRLKSPAPSILPEDICEHLQAKATHVAPIANEIKQSTIDTLQSRTGVMSIDIQGFIRRFSSSGDMALGKIYNTKFLKGVEVLKASQEELRAAMGTEDLGKSTRQIGKKGVRIIVVTKGAEGSIIYLQERSYKIPSFRTDLIKDRTGAGDVYMGSFLAEYVRDRDPVWCASVGSSAASFIIQETGPRGLPEKKKIYERAEDLFQKVTDDV